MNKNSKKKTNAKKEILIENIILTPGDMKRRRSDFTEDEISEKETPASAPRGASEKVVKSRNYDETHTKILEAMFELISQKGFKSTTTREIATAAGITEVTLYRHFPSKGAIFEELAQKYTMVGVISKLPPEIEKFPLEKKIKFIVQKLLEILKKQNKIFRIMVSESMMHPQQAKMLFEKIPFQIVNKVADLFEKEQKAGIIKENLNHRLIARSLTGMFMAYNLMQEILYGKEFESFDFEEVIDNYLEIFLNGVLKK